MMMQMCPHQPTGKRWISLSIYWRKNYTTTEKLNFFHVYLNNNNIIMSWLNTCWTWSWSRNRLWRQSRQEQSIFKVDHVHLINKEYMTCFIVTRGSSSFNKNVRYVKAYNSEYHSTRNIFTLKRISKCCFHLVSAKLEGHNI